MTASTLTLYDRIGGKPAIDAAVELFYQRVIADPELNPFFAPMSVERIKTHQKAFFAMALGGAAHYQGRGMKEAHAQLGIRAVHFDRVAEHLGITLEDLGVEPGVRNETLTLVALLKSQIVSSE
ncbi:group I truncated hemoglobin [Bryobacter aggregatus]|uniref:group I truncated hemoglobin n=1 Tax=Bryobacter aggregatus TaxID=360054 RepID=UPI0004E102E8|nr:group 1 truncated hemoglobin [Bryobacter aggregatus]